MKPTSQDFISTEDNIKQEIIIRSIQKKKHKTEGPNEAATTIQFFFKMTLCKKKLINSRKAAQLKSLTLIKYSN